MIKKLLCIATLVGMLGSIVYAGEALQDGVHAAGSSAQGIQVQGNDLKPWTASTLDLGSVALPFKDLEMTGNATIAGTASITGAVSITGDISGGADVRSTAFLGIGVPYDVNVVTATTIAVTGSNLRLWDDEGAQTGTITMTAQPVFSTTTASVGDFLLVTTTEPTRTYIVDEGDDEALQLGSSSRSITQYDSLYLIFESSGSAYDQNWWREIVFTAN